MPEFDLQMEHTQLVCHSYSFVKLPVSGIVLRRENESACVWCAHVLGRVICHSEH